MGVAHGGLLLLAAAVARVGAISVKGFCDVKLVGNHTAYAHGKWVQGTLEEREVKRASTCLNRDYSCGSTPKLLKSMSWRWSPDGCALRPFDEDKFSQLLQGRKLLFFGDSLSMCMADSLSCMGIDHDRERWDLLGLGTGKGPLDPGSSPINSWLGEGMQKTMDEHESWKMVIERKGIKPEDIIVFNAGAHRIPEGDREGAIRRLASAVSSLHKGLIFYRPTTIGHKECWNYDGPIESMSDAQYKAFTENMYNWDEFHVINNLFIQSFREAAADRFHVLDVSMFELRPDGHVSQVFHDSADPEKESKKADCLHYCVPGPIDTWNYLLYHHLAALL